MYEIGLKVCLSENKIRKTKNYSKTAKRIILSQCILWHVVKNYVNQNAIHPQALRPSPDWSSNSVSPWLSYNLTVGMRFFLASENRIVPEAASLRATIASNPRKHRMAISIKTSRGADKKPSTARRALHIHEGRAAMVQPLARAFRDCISGRGRARNWFYETAARTRRGAPHERGRIIKLQKEAHFARARAAAAP